ncbi:MAG TPA: hypothetical protein VH372_19160 [Actinospica sp.]|nr:hypothetical protein [Actinospica sp.]
MKRIYVSTMVSAAAGIAAVGLIAGCSSGSGTSTAAATGAASSDNAAYSAYTQCLSQHGVKLPSRGAFTAGARRSHSPGADGFTPGARPSGGFGGGFASADPSMAAAAQACSSLRPSGAASFGGGGFGGGSTRLAAFRNCMTQQGETVPTTRPTAAVTPAPTGDARYLDGLDPADPKVAAALNVCKALIPTGAPSASAT